MAAPLLIYLKLGTFTINQIFTIKRPWILETSLFIIFIIIIGLFIRYNTIKINENFFTFAKSQHYGKYGFFIYLFSYTIHSFLQEILVRGIIISGTIHNFPKLSKFYIILVTSLAFGIAHFYFGIFTMIITTISGIIFGILYLRQQNIWGVSFIHYFTGLLAISFGWA